MRFVKTTSLLLLALVPFSAVAQDCTRIDSELAFCGTAPDWTELPEIFAPYLIGFEHRDGTLVGLGIERAGADDGVTYEALATFNGNRINALNAREGVAAHVLSFGANSVDGTEAQDLVAIIKPGAGAPTIVANTSIIRPEITIQIATFFNGQPAFGPDDQSFHNDVLSLIQVGDPKE